MYPYFDPATGQFAKLGTASSPTIKSIEINLKHLNSGMYLLQDEKVGGPALKLILR